MTNIDTTVRDPRERTPDYATVQMVNEGPTEFVGVYTGQEFRAGPGERIFVPFYAMCLWAGHPDALDIDRRRRYRTDELMRLQVKYGTHSFNGCWTTDICEGNPGTDGKRKHPPTRHLPNIHFYRVEDNTEYATVLADPEGKRISPTATQVGSQDTLESRALRDLQNTVERLQKELAVVQHSQGQSSIPPAPEPRIPPMPGSSTSTGGDNMGMNMTDPGVDPPPADSDTDPDLTADPPDAATTSAIPVDEAAIERARTRKPKIPPTPGPL